MAMTQTDLEFQRAEELLEQWRTRGHVSGTPADTNKLFKYLSHVKSELDQSKEDIKRLEGQASKATSKTKVVPLNGMTNHDSRVLELEEKVKALKDALEKRGTAKAVQILMAENMTLRAKLENADRAGEEDSTEKDKIIAELRSEITRLKALETRPKAFTERRTESDDLVEKIREELRQTLEALEEARTHEAVLQAENDQLKNEMASQTEHMMSMERQIIDGIPMPDGERNEFSDLVDAIQAALRSDLAVKVTVEHMAPVQKLFEFGG